MKDSTFNTKVHMPTFCKLNQMIAIEVIGEQAIPFLHGQLTNHILDIQHTHFSQNLLCNIKGRIISIIDVCFANNKLYIVLAKNLWPKVDSILNKVNASIDMKYYNDVIMNTTTQSEGTMNKNIIDYNNDSNINDVHNEEDDGSEDDGDEVESKK